MIALSVDIITQLLNESELSFRFLFLFFLYAAHNLRKGFCQRVNLDRSPPALCLALAVGDPALIAQEMHRKTDFRLAEISTPLNVP